MATRRLVIELDLDSGKYTANIKAATGQLGAFQSAVERADKATSKNKSVLEKTSGTVKELVTTLGLARFALENVHFFFLQWAQSMIMASAQVERQIQLLKGLSSELTTVGKNTEAAENLNYLFDLARNAPFSMQSLTDSFVKFKTAGIDPTNGSLQGLVDAVANFGGTEQQLARASIAIQQMSGKGVVSMEELRQQLGEAVPSAIQQMADGLGMSMSDLVKRISDGEVKSSVALKKMLAMFNLTYGGAAQQMMQTFSGQLSQLKTNLIEVSMAFTGLQADGTTQQGAFFDVVRQQLIELNVLLQSNAFQKFAADVGFAMGQTFTFIKDVIVQMMRINDVIPVFKLLGATIAATAAIITTRFIAGALVGMMTSLGATTAGVRVATGSVALLKTELAAASAMIMSTSGAMGKLSAATVLSGSVMRAFGIALSGMLGWITLAITGIYAVVTAFGLLENKAKSAKNAIDAYNRTGLTSVEDYNAALTEQGSLLSQITDKRAQLARARMEDPTGGKSPQVQRIAQDLLTLTKRYQEVRKAAGEMKQSVTDSIGQDTGNRLTTRLLGPRGPLAQFDQERRQAKVKYDKIRTDQKSTQEQIAAAQKEYTDKLDASARREIATIDTLISASRRESQARKMKAADLVAINTVIEKLEDRRSALVDASSAALGSNEGAFVAKPPKVDRNAGASRAATANRAARIAQVRSEKDAQDELTASLAATTVWREKEIALLNNKVFASQAEKALAISRIEEQSSNRRAQAYKDFEQQVAASMQGNKSLEQKALRETVTQEAAALERAAQLRSQAAGIHAEIAESGKEAAKMLTLLNTNPKMVGYSEQIKKELMDAATAVDMAVDAKEAAAAFKKMQEELVKNQAALKSTQEDTKLLASGATDAAIDTARYAATWAKVAEEADMANEEVKKMLPQIIELYRTQKAQENSNSALSQLSKEANTAKEEANALFRDLLGGTIQSDSALNSYISRMNALARETLPEAQAAANKFRDDAINAEKRRVGISAAIDMRRETARMNRESMMDSVAAARQEMEEKVRLMRENLNLQALNGEERKRIEADYYSYVEALQNNFDEENNPLLKISKEWLNATKLMKDASTGWVDSFAQDLVKGSLKWDTFVTKILEDIAIIYIRAIITQAILSVIGMVGGSSAPSASMPPSSSMKVPNIGQNILPTFAHTGGIVGGYMPNARKSVSASLFAGAPRLHAGMYPGLKGDEFPTILQKGEGVFTKEQMAAMGSGGGMPNVIVNVVNQTGTKMNADQQGETRFDGANFILDVVVNAASKPGKMRDAIKGVAAS